MHSRYFAPIAIFDRDRRTLRAAELTTVSRCSDRHAFVQLLHLFFSKMHKDSSRASTTISRRCSSSVDLPAPSRPTSRESIRRQKSFEIQGMHRSALRLLGMYGQLFDNNQLDDHFAGGFCVFSNPIVLNIAASFDATISLSRSASAHPPLLLPDTTSEASRVFLCYADQPTADAPSIG